MKSFGKYFILILAIFGFFFSIFMIYYSSKKTKVAPIVFQPPIPPYIHYVAGPGIIEAASENIDIGTPFPEIVEKVYVEAGTFVKKNEPLFKLNTQTKEAELYQYIKQKEIKEKNLEDQKIQFSFYERLKNKNAVSESEYNNQFYNLQIAQKELEEIEAKINVSKTNIERSTIKAPIDGEILDVNLREGENAQTNPFQKTYLLLFGNLDNYHIRIDIDETDAWRIYKKAPATAFVRGNSSIKIPLEFVSIEPYIVPKVSLTGDNKEKVDIRVLQLIYKFKKDNLPVYVGQILDVYIEAKPSDYRYNEKDNYNH